MTSQLGKEDLRAELYAAGIRTPYRIERLMRLIETYALAQVRKVAPLEDVPPDRYAHLGPGESDVTHEVTRCKACSAVKDWHLFHADSGNPPSGRKRTCKSCLRERQPPPPKGTFLCRRCGKPRTLEEFPEEKTRNHSSPVLCTYCK